MAKIKGKKKLEKIINEFTQQFGVKAKLGPEFLAFADSGKIHFAVATMQEDNNFFIEDAVLKYPEIQAPPFIWLLMHEIGHCMTDHYFSAAEQEYITKMKDKLAYLSDDQDRNDWYHSLPDEFNATRWAAIYMIEHPKKIAKFWNKAQKAIQNFYIENNVIDE